MPVLTDEQIKAIESRFGNIPSDNAPPPPSSAPSSGTSVENRMGAPEQKANVVEEKPQTTPADYINVPWYGDDDSVYSRFKKNAMGDVGHVFSGTAEAIMHPMQTYEALKGVGKGAYNTAAEAMGSELSPEEKETKKYWQAAIQPYKELAEPGGFKRAVAEHPAQLATDLSLPLTGAEGVAARLGMSGTAKALNIASKANPLGVTGEALSGALGKASDLTGYTANKIFDVPKSAVPRAFEAGQEANPHFLKHYFGFGNEDSILDAFQNGVDKAYKDRGSKYLNSQDALREMQQPLSYDKVDNALSNSNRYFVDQQFGRNINPAGTKLVDEMRQFVNDWGNKQSQTGGVTAGMPHSPGDFDLLKKAFKNEFEDKAKATGATLAYNDGYNAIRQTIVVAAPRYAQDMMDYGDLSDTIKKITATGKLGGKADKQTAIDRLLGTYADKKKIVELLAPYEPNLGAMIAGQQLRLMAPSSLSLPTMFFAPQYAAASFPGVYGGGAYAAGLGSSALTRGMPAVYEGERVQGRQGHASGGKVDHKSAEALSDQLVAAFARAKKDEELETKVLLNKPDEMIIDALKEAKKAI